MTSKHRAKKGSFALSYLLSLRFLDPYRHRQVNLIVPISAAEAACARRSSGNTCSPSRVSIRRVKGDCFAKAHISAAQTPPRQNARVSFAHEDRRWPQGPGGSPQEGTPSPYARVVPGGRIRPPLVSFAKRISMPFTVMASAVPIPFLPFSRKRTICRRAALASASNALSVTR